MQDTFFAEADLAKEHSCDVHTKIGAILVNLHGNVLISECNNMPVGIKVAPERLERPTKYSYIEHAERNAIYSAALQGISPEGLIMVMSCNPVPCTECARAVIQSGIAMIVGRDMGNLASSRWDESCRVAQDMLQEAGVAIVFVKNKGEFRVVGSLSEQYKIFLEKNFK